MTNNDLWYITNIYQDAPLFTNIVKVSKAVCSRNILFVFSDNRKVLAHITGVSRVKLSSKDYMVQFSNDLVIELRIILKIVQGNAP
jgi:hypothetical protein